MKKFSILIILFLGLISCVTYRMDSRPPTDFHFSPPIETNPQVFEKGKSLPEQKIILLPEEYSYSYQPVKPWLVEQMGARNFDGSIINHRSFSASDYYGGPQHYVEHQPFIYFDRFEERDFFDYIEVQVWNSNGDRLRSFRLDFDWNSQLKFFPENMSREDYDVVAIQPWFFLQQRNSLWRTAVEEHNGWPQRTFGTGLIYYSFIPRLNYDAYIVRRSGFRLQVNLKLSESGMPTIASISRHGEKLEYSAEDFFGRTLKQSFISPEGLKYRLHYHYKSTEDIPQEWIVDPKDLH